MSSKRDAILELARRYDYDPQHAHHVECLAGTLFTELEPLHSLPREDRKLLEYAAILHDIGYYVRAQGHHRHALQMIMMEPLMEFSRDEKSIIANVARYHRKALPSREHTAFSILAEEDQRRVLLLAPILRLADALDRGHIGRVQELFCEIGQTLVTLHIGTEAELVEEHEAAARKGDMFKTVYGRDLRIVVTQPRLPSERPPAETRFEAVPGLSAEGLSAEEPLAIGAQTHNSLVGGSSAKG